MYPVSFGFQVKQHYLGEIFGFKSEEKNANGLLDENEQTELGGVVFSVEDWGLGDVGASGRREKPRSLGLCI